MSENDKEEVTIEFVNENASPAQVRFADGVHELSALTIARIGGISELTSLADALTEVTYEEFLRGLNDVMRARQLNDYQAQVIANHFGPRF